MKFETISNWLKAFILTCTTAAPNLTFNEKRTRIYNELQSGDDEPLLQIEWTDILKGRKTSAVQRLLSQ